MTVNVGGYTLIELAGMWFLEDETGRIAATIVDMGGGTFRARTPEGSVRTVEVPAGEKEPATYVAEQIT